LELDLYEGDHDENETEDVLDIKDALLFVFVNGNNINVDKDEDNTSDYGDN
jgi:hypothetical protein